VTDLGPCFPGHDRLPLLGLTCALGHCGAGALAWLTSGDLQGVWRALRWVRHRIMHLEGWQCRVFTLRNLLMQMHAQVVASTPG
jgi:hypothetical protein